MQSAAPSAIAEVTTADARPPHAYTRWAHTAHPPIHKLSAAWCRCGRYEKEAREKNRDSWFLAFIMDTNEEERAKGKTVEVCAVDPPIRARARSCPNSPAQLSCPTLRLCMCSPPYPLCRRIPCDGECRWAVHTLTRRASGTRSSTRPGTRTTYQI